MALVDEADFERLNAWSWCATRAGYALRGRPGGGAIYMHREVIGTPSAGMVIDHINGNPSDNRRANLRFCTLAQNTRNRRTRGTAAGFKGVVYLRATGKYRAVICADGIGRNSACFHTAVAAALAYDVMARLFHGEFAAPNFPDHEVPIEWRPGSQHRAQPRFRAIRKAEAA